MLLCFSHVSMHQPPRGLVKTQLLGPSLLNSDSVRSGMWLVKRPVSTQAAGPPSMS